MAMVIVWQNKFMEFVGFICVGAPVTLWCKADILLICLVLSHSPLAQLLFLNVLTWAETCNRECDFLNLPTQWYFQTHFDPKLCLCTWT